MSEAMEKDLRYVRRPEHDKRIGRGDDFAGDAWEDTEQTIASGKMAIIYTVVGHDPNKATKE